MPPSGRDVAAVACVEYLCFMQRLWNWACAADHSVGRARNLFFFLVREKADALRMIVDRRLVKRRFREPPGVSLATLESLAALQS